MSRGGPVRRQPGLVRVIDPKVCCSTLVQGTSAETATTNDDADATKRGGSGPPPEPDATEDDDRAPLPILLGSRARCQRTRRASRSHRPINLTWGEVSRDNEFEMSDGPS